MVFVNAVIGYLCCGRVGPPLQYKFQVLFSVLIISEYEEEGGGVVYEVVFATLTLFSLSVEGESRGVDWSGLGVSNIPLGKGRICPCDLALSEPCVF